MRKDRQPRAPRDPRAIGDVLVDLLAQRGYAQISAGDECRQVWARIVGDLADFSCAAEVKRGTLQVVVSNSVVMQELNFRKQELVAELKTALPKSRIRDLRFRLGSLS